MSVNETSELRHQLQSARLDLVPFSNLSLALCTSPSTSSIPAPEGLAVLWMHPAFTTVRLLLPVTTMSVSIHHQESTQTSLLKDDRPELAIFF